MNTEELSMPGLLAVISGPSGVGKTTIAREIESRIPGAMLSVSATTRPKTSADVEGRDYDFLTEEQFRARIEAGEMLEWARVFEKHWYGTPRRPVEQALAEGRVVILEIDVQGAIQIRRSLPEAFMLFIEPPDEQELLRRLRARGREDESTIQRRFAEARREIALAHESGTYDRFVINEALDRAIDEICAAIAHARSRSGSGLAEDSE